MSFGLDDLVPKSPKEGVEIRNRNQNPGWAKFQENILIPEQKEQAEKKAKENFVQELVQQIKFIKRGSSPKEFMKFLRDFKSEYELQLSNEESYKILTDLGSFGNSEFHLLKPIWKESNRILHLWEKIYLAKLHKKSEAVPEDYKLDPFTGKFYPKVNLVGVLSGVHGDETTAPEGVDAIIRIIREIETFGLTGFSRNPFMYFNPRVNEEGLEHGMRGVGSYSNSDINRSNAEGPAKELRDALMANTKRAFGNFETSPNPLFVLDFHNAPSRQEAINNPSKNIDGTTNENGLDFENTIEKAYTAVALKPGTVVDQEFLEKSEIKRIIDFLKAIGIDDVRFYPNEIAQTTIVGELSRDLPVYGIALEFPQTSTQGNMTDQEFVDLQYQERYNSIATMARAMLLYEGLQSDNEESDYSLPLQLQWIAGSRDFPEAVDGCRVSVTKNVPDGVPNSDFYDFSQINTGERDIFVRTDKILTIEQMKQISEKVLQNQEYKIITEEGLEIIQPENPVELLKSLAKKGFVMHGSSKLFESVSPQNPHKNDSKEVGRDMESLIYTSGNGDWLTPLVYAFTKRVEDGGGQSNIGITSQTKEGLSRLELSNYDLTNSQIELANPTKEGYIYVFDPRFFEPNPFKSNHPVEWTNRDEIDLVNPIMRIKVKYEDLGVNWKN
jgi:uncharacterized protein (UPF0128 family)